MYFPRAIGPLLLLAMVLACNSVGCDSSQRGESQTAASADQPPTETPSELEKHGMEPDEEDTASEPAQPTALERYTEDLDDDGLLMVAIDTTHGTIECELFAEKAPYTVTNFVGLARGMKAFVDPDTGHSRSGIPFYDDVEFHRVIPGFLIQAGDRSGQGHGGPGYTIPDEFSDDLRHDRAGILSMANRGPDTAGSQFFILEKPAPDLDGRHSVFGHCDSPQVIRSISHVPTSEMGRPVDPPRIESMEFFRAK